MSIINDALKKAGQNLQKNSPPDSAAQKPGRLKTALLYVLILSAGLYLANFIFTMLNRSAGSGKNRPAASGKKQNRILSPAATVAPAAATPASTQEPLLQPSLPENKLNPADFILSGIFVSGDDAYALINNRIVRVNDYVGSAKVNAISEGAVELENTAGKITLTTSR